MVEIANLDCVELPAVHRQFVVNYLVNGGNGTAAYRAVRPSVSEESAAVGACRLLQRPAVRQAIDVALAAEEITIEKIVQELARIAFKPLPELSDSEFKAKIRALELLGRWRGMFSERRETDAQDGLETRLKEAMRRLESQGDAP